MSCILLLGCIDISVAEHLVEARLFHSVMQKKTTNLLPGKWQAYIMEKHAVILNRFLELGFLWRGVF